MICRQEDQGVGNKTDGPSTLLRAAPSSSRGGISARDFILGIVSVVGWSLFAVLPPLIRSRSVVALREMELALPALTRFYLSCPTLLYVATSFVFAVLTILALVLMPSAWRRRALNSIVVILSLNIAFYLLALLLPLRMMGKFHSP
jgi:hypothetical protein